MNKEKKNQTSEFAREIWKKSKRFCKDENCDAPQYIEVNEVFEIIHKYIEDLKKKAELGDHYKHLYSEVKKQKDDAEICKEWNRKNNFNDINYERDIKRFDFVLDKMNELEGKNNNGIMDKNSR